MKTSEFVALEKRLIPDLPGLAIMGALLFNSPIDKLLRGVVFEGSSFSKTAFYANQFVLPLCLPTDYLYFTFGDRVRGDRGADGWNTLDPGFEEELKRALNRQTLPFLSRVASLSQFIDEAAASRGSVRELECLGYALARAGRFDEAVATFDRLLADCDISGGWQRELSEDVGDLRRMIIDDPSRAAAQLVEWERDTVRALKLEKFCTPT